MRSPGRKCVKKRTGVTIFFYLQHFILKPSKHTLGLGRLHSEPSSCYQYFHVLLTGLHFLSILLGLVLLDAPGPFPLSQPCTGPSPGNLGPQGPRGPTMPPPWAARSWALRWTGWGCARSVCSCGCLALAHAVHPTSSTGSFSCSPVLVTPYSGWGKPGSLVFSDSLHE